MTGGQNEGLKEMILAILPKNNGLQARVFYLLDCVTPTEIFQIGHREKRRHGHFLQEHLHSLCKIDQS